MRFIKKNVKLIIGIVIGILLVSGISVYAATKYYASQVEYKDGKNVEEALNDLYGLSNSLDNIELLYSYNSGLSINDTYTFEEDYSRIIIFMYGCSRDNNVLLNYSISNGEIFYDKTTENMYDTYDKGRVVIIDNVPKDTVLTYLLQCQPGIFIFGVK